MKLGAFSISLAVEDLAASRAFYEAFGFEFFGGDHEQNWLILKNEEHIQLNEGQHYAYDRDALVKMLEEALATARPRSK